MDEAPKRKRGRPFKVPSKKGRYDRWAKGLAKNKNNNNNGKNHDSNHDNNNGNHNNDKIDNHDNGDGGDNVCSHQGRSSCRNFGGGDVGNNGFGNGTDSYFSDESSG